MKSNSSGGPTSVKSNALVWVHTNSSDCIGLAHTNEIDFIGVGHLKKSSGKVLQGNLGRILQTTAKGLPRGFLHGIESVLWEASSSKNL
jgi:hypothetical protein